MEINANILLSILFTADEPIALSELINKLGIPTVDLKKVLYDLDLQLKDTSLMLMLTDNSVRLVTRPEYGKYIRQFYGSKRQTLSREALETLAMIVYKQPVTRQEIEAIRGVDSEKTISTLLRAKLIKPSGNLAQQGAPILYTLTEECLYLFGVKNYSELSSILTRYFEKGG